MGKLSLLIISGAVAIASPCYAQSIQLPGEFAPGTSMGFGARGTTWTPVTSSTPLPTAAKQEAYTLVSANEPTAPVTVYGGHYVVTQSCASYGTVTLRYRGPDGATMTPLISRTSADFAGGTLVAIGSNAIVDATLSNTTGCNVQIARLP